MSEHLNDILDIDLSPFKGPFKGKGANRKAIGILRVEQQRILEVMHSVISDYEQALPRLKQHGPILHPRLRVHGSPDIPQLWWRESVGNSKFVRLFDCERGEIILKRYMPATIELFKRFDRRRANINLQSGMVGYALRKYKLYMTDLDILDNANR